MENLINSFGKAIEKIKVTQMITIGVVLFFMIFAFIALSIVQKRLKKKLPIGSDLKRKNNYSTIFRIIRVVIACIGIIVILQTLGINMSWFAISFSGLAVLVGLAMKDLLQDLFAGTTIMVDKFFAVGDAVEFDGRDGVVVYFTLRTTKIEFLDDRSVLSVMNRNISKIRKLTHLVDIDLPLSYDEDPKHVYQTLTGICDYISRLDGIESCTFKGTQAFDKSAVIYKIRFFCEPNERPDIRRAVLRIIQDGLQKADIRIPYQQLDIHQL